MENNYGFLFLSVLANTCQLESWQMNRKSLSNETLLKYLQHQDNDFLKTIIEQNKTIINQNEEILKYIKK